MWFPFLQYIAKAMCEEREPTMLKEVCGTWRNLEIALWRLTSLADQAACPVNGANELNVAEEQSCVSLNWKVAGVVSYGRQV